MLVMRLVLLRCRVSLSAHFFAVFTTTGVLLVHCGVGGWLAFGKYLACYSGAMRRVGDGGSSGSTVCGVVVNSIPDPS